MENLRENCVVCAFKAIMKFSTICGLPAFRINCSHEKNIIKFKITHSRLLVVAILIVVLILFVNFCYYIYLFKLALSEKVDNAKIAIYMIHLSSYSSAGVIIVLNLLHSHFDKSFFEVYLTLINRWLSYGYGPILPYNYVKLSYNLSFSFAITCSLLLCAFPIIHYVQTWSLFTFVLKVSEAIAAYFELCMFVSMFNWITFNLIAWRNGQKFFMEEMKKRLAFPASVTSNSTMALLRRFRKLNYSLHSCTTQMSLFANPTLLIWLFSGLEIMISCVLGNIYTIFLQDNDVEMSNDMVQIQLRSGLTGIVLSLLYAYQLMEDVDHDLLSFLYKYPISKLSKEEAKEVEMIIRYLKYQKPIITTSGVVTLGVGLVPVFSGYVLTYVLVAIQFLKEWKN